MIPLGRTAAFERSQSISNEAVLSENLKIVRLIMFLVISDRV
jgi:hypothetical protein